MGLTSKQINIDHEQQQLQKVRQCINNEAKNIEERRKNIINFFSNSDDDYSNRHRRNIPPEIGKLNQISNEPYTARLILLDKLGNNNIDVYIGKEPLEIDNTVHINSIWGELGKVLTQGVLPNGVELQLKRRITILKNVTNVLDEVNVVENYYADQLTCDSFLIDNLRQSSSNRMKDIVATLQKEQDQIIRENLDSIIIIQGVAGSGKTAIAYHRIPYLFFNYKEKMIGNVLVIGPSRVYLSFLSQLLSDLGINSGVEQSTLEQLLRENSMPAEYDISPLTEDKEEYFFEDVLSFLDKYDDAFFASLCNQIPQPEINQYFTCLNEIIFPSGSSVEGKKISYKVPANLLKNIPVNLRAAKYEEILIEHLIVDYGLAGQSRGANVRESLKKQFPIINKYFSLWPKITAFKVLEDLINEFGGLSTSDYYGAALLCKNYVDGLPKYSHIIIDEAQNLSPLAIASITRFQNDRSRSMTIVGDACQRYDDAFFSWQSYETILKGFKNDVVMKVLRKSYRSTDQIIRFCNYILKNAVLTPNDYNDYAAETVGRDGLPPVVAPASVLEIQTAVAELMNVPLVKLVAVICKEQQQCENVAAALAKFSPTIIGKGGDDDYPDAGVVIASAKFIRGLEFDAVVIPDADNYSSNRKDAKIFYTVCSRGMHALTVLYKRHIPRYLEEMRKEGLALFRPLND
jgi:DNA helicase-2/ATP-dependent DNA helicase PcrA